MSGVLRKALRDVYLSMDNDVGLKEAMYFLSNLVFRALCIGSRDNRNVGGLSTPKPRKVSKDSRFWDLPRVTSYMAGW